MDDDRRRRLSDQVAQGLGGENLDPAIGIKPGSALDAGDQNRAVGNKNLRPITVHGALLR